MATSARRNRQKKCAFCGTPTTTQVWTNGTTRRWTLICDALACWKKYWDSLK
jgi:hypothetical protein